MVLILVKVSVKVAFRSTTSTDCRQTYTDTSTRISSMEIALCLQSVAVVDRQATFTDTSTEISSMEVALCLQSVAVVDRGKERIISLIHRYFHQDR